MARIHRRAAAGACLLALLAAAPAPAGATLVKPKKPVICPPNCLACGERGRARAVRGARRVRVPRPEGRIICRTGVLAAGKGRMARPRTQPTARPPPVRPLPPSSPPPSPHPPARPPPVRVRGRLSKKDQAAVAAAAGSRRLMTLPPLRTVCTKCDAGYTPSKPYGTQCREFSRVLVPPGLRAPRHPRHR
jgi:hypothetical protein